MCESTKLHAVTLSINCSRVISLKQQLLYTSKRISGIQWFGGSVEATPSLDMALKKNSVCSCWESVPKQPVPNYTFYWLRCCTLLCKICSHSEIHNSCLKQILILCIFHNIHWDTSAKSLSSQAHTTRIHCD